MSDLKYYLFGGLIGPKYKSRVCLAGPFSTAEAAREATQNNQWANWIIDQDQDNIEIGQEVEVPFAFDAKDDLSERIRVVEDFKG